MGDKIIMSQKEILRMPVISKILSKQMKQIEGAKLLNLSPRQINRIIQEAKTKNIHEVLIHKSRGKISKCKVSENLKKKIKKLYVEKYADFKPTFFSEKLAENHDIKLSKETIRKILIEDGLWETNKINKVRCHVWRERKSHFGELIQFDGSHHRWLENRLDKEFCLLVYIDDATGEKFARFYEYEGTMPAIDSLKRFVEKYGIPKAIYCDRHPAYFTTKNQNLDEQLENKFPKTQFAEVVEKLKIELIHARSPQAKGRVERANAIFQDRLVKELRLANICTIDAANHFLETIFLPKINKKFNVLPKSDVSFFRPSTDAINLDEDCSVCVQRTICNDFTIRWQNRVFLLLNRTPKMKKKKVIIKLYPDGNLQFFTKDSLLRVQEISHNFNSKISAA